VLGRTAQPAALTRRVPRGRHATLAPLNGTCTTLHSLEIGPLDSLSYLNTAGAFRIVITRVTQTKSPRTIKRDINVTIRLRDTGIHFFFFRLVPLAPWRLRPRSSALRAPSSCPSSVTSIEEGSNSFSIRVRQVTSAFVSIQVCGNSGPCYQRLSTTKVIINEVIYER
jgi:hypothetical protein